MLSLWGFFLYPYSKHLMVVHGTNHIYAKTSFKFCRYHCNLDNTFYRYEDFHIHRIVYRYWFVRWWPKEYCGFFKYFLGWCCFLFLLFCFLFLVFIVVVVGLDLFSFSFFYGGGGGGGSVYFLGLKPPKKLQ